MARAQPGRVPSRSAFALMTAGFVALMSATTVPTPVYGVYEQTMGLTQAQITAIYAVYAVPLIITLMTVGALSDYIGRRPLLMIAFGLGAVGMVIFATADSVGHLVVARLVHGVATGTATGALASGLIDWAPQGRPRLGSSLASAAPTIGLSLGALVSGLLVEYAPHPTVTVYVVFFFVYVALGLWTFLIREPRLDRSGALASLVPRLGVPRGTRTVFFWLVPGIVGIAAIGGQFNALAPIVLDQVLEVGNTAIGSAVILAVHGSATIAAMAGGRIHDVGVLLIGGIAALALGSAGIMASVLAGLPIGYFVAAAVCGAGIGSVFLGSIRVTAAIAPYGRRAGLMSTLNVINYTALTIPLLFVGIAATEYGLLPTLVVYTAIQIVIAAVAAAGQLWLLHTGVLPRTDEEGARQGPGATPG